MTCQIMRFMKQQPAVSGVVMSAAAIPGDKLSFTPNITEDGYRMTDWKQSPLNPNHLFLAPYNVLVMDGSIIAVTRKRGGGGRFDTDWHCHIVAPDKAFLNKNLFEDNERTLVI